MKKFLLIFGLIMSFGLFAYAQSDKDTCTYKGCPLKARVRIVEYNEDFLVRIVGYNEDVQIKLLDYTPRNCKEWEIVEYNEDVRIRLVDYNEDFSVRFVDYTPR